MSGVHILLRQTKVNSELVLLLQQLKYNDSVFILMNLVSPLCYHLYQLIVFNFF
jgi:hypothetical protein